MLEGTFFDDGYGGDTNIYLDSVIGRRRVNDYINNDKNNKDDNEVVYNDNDAADLDYVIEGGGDNNKGSRPVRKVQFFLTLFKRPLTPPPPPFV